MKKIPTSIGLCMLIAGIARSLAAKNQKLTQGLPRKVRWRRTTNSQKRCQITIPNAIARLLSDDWVVISARGEVGEGEMIFPNATKSGRLKHTTYEASEPRVRLFGNVALVTERLHNAGTSLVGTEHKPYEAMQIQTDVWLWKDGEWKCVLIHESWEGAERDQKLLRR